MMMRLLFLLLCVLTLAGPAQAQEAQQWYYGGAQPQQAPASQAERRVPMQQPAPSVPAQVVGEPAAEEAYLLGPGDKLRVTVYEEPDLSGEFDVDGSGRIALPLVGEVSAHKQTVRQLEQRVATLFRDGYLINPRVSIEVMNFRHFYIMGEVKQPGSYPYVNALTVLNAVAVAGGYTYRAKSEDMEITRRMPDGTVQKFKANEATKVMPEDTIRVKERFF